MLTHFTAAAENNTQQHRAFFTLLVWLPPRLPNCAWNDRRVALSIACDSKWNTHTRISEEFSRSLRTFYHNRHLISLDLTCTFRVLKHKSHIALPSRLWRTWKGKRLLKKHAMFQSPPFGNKSVELQCLSYNSCHWLLIWSSLLKRKHFMARSFLQARTLRCNICDLSESCTPVRLQSLLAIPAHWCWHLHWAISLCSLVAQL